MSIRSSLSLPLRALVAAVGMAWLALGGVASAQDADLTSARAETCAARGKVTVTILGVPTTTPLTCFNHTEQASPGEDDASTSGDVVSGVPLVANVATVNAPEGESVYANEAPSSTVLTGDTSADHASLAQGEVATGGLHGRMQCRATTGSTTIQCSAGAALESLSVNGSPVTIPSQPIPINHPVAVSGLNVQVSVAGIGLVNVPASGTLYLNRVRTQGEGTNSVKIEHATISLELSGQTSVLGFGPVGVTLFVDDQDLIEYALMAGFVAVAAGAISLPPPQ